MFKVLERQCQGSEIVKIIRKIRETFQSYNRVLSADHLKDIPLS